MSASDFSCRLLAPVIALPRRPLSSSASRVELEQPLEAVVAIDDATVEVVEVRGRETAAVERHQRAQVGRQHRQDVDDHPLRVVAGLDEGLDHLEALGQLLDLGRRVGFGQLLAHLRRLGLEVELAEQGTDRLGAHAGAELVTVLLERLEVLVLGHQRTFLERRQAGVDDDVTLEVEYPLDIAHRHVEDQAHARRQRLQEPDVGHRRGQLDVAHALAAHLGVGHLDAALLAHHAAMLEPLVLAAQALVIADRAEQLGTEQAVTLRLEGAVVDRFRLLHLAERPGTDLLGRRQAYADGIEVLALVTLAEKIE